jgi:predicted RecB family nuclease
MVHLPSANTDPGEHGMDISASDISELHTPSRCDLRVFLRHRGEAEALPGPYQQLLVQLGLRHEDAHLASLPDVVDLATTPVELRAARTLEAIAAGAPAIHHARFENRAAFDGTEVRLIGEPDFLIRTEVGYVIRDCKLARRIERREHTEIFLQLGLYAWLFEQCVGTQPAGVQVYSGARELVPIGADVAAALDACARVLRLRTLSDEPFEAVGWSKCNHCGFRERCWPAAVQRRDVAIVPDVDQGLVTALRLERVVTVSDLLAGFDEPRLSALKRPVGQQVKRVGKRAGPILRSATALETGQEITIAAPSLPPGPDYVMFDLEGVPPLLEELETVYLWGLQVFGQRPGAYIGVTAGIGPDGDRQGWAAFLEQAAGLFDTHGDLPFVHWHHYERSKLDMYIERHGDPDGVAARVRRNLVDLLVVTRQSVALPLPSYSLKVVEKHIDFQRSEGGVGGDWAIAQYIEATEVGDPAKREALLADIRRYNREDLVATWAAFCWLRDRRW